MYLAAHYGLTEMIEILIKHGADVNAVMINGMTPLMQAEASGVQAAMDCLIKHGAVK